MLNKKVEVFEDKVVAGDWRVEDGPDGDGVIDVAIFSGPRAEALAYEYFEWKRGRPPRGKMKSLARLRIAEVRNEN